jgi:hypothetical protein
MISPLGLTFGLPGHLSIFRSRANTPWRACGLPGEAGGAPNGDAAEQHYQALIDENKNHALSFPIMWLGSLEWSFT